MYLRLASFPLLLLLLFFQAPGDLFRKHYEAANNYHRAGNYSGAEAEFKIILGQAYQRLGKIYSAQGNYKSSVETLEAASATRPDRKIISWRDLRVIGRPASCPPDKPQQRLPMRGK